MARDAEGLIFWKDVEVLMSMIAWIVIGLISGSIAGKIIKRSRGILFRHTAFGVIGACLGGLAAVLVTERGVIGAMGVNGIRELNVPSLFAAILGAALLLIADQVFRRAPRSGAQIHP